MTLPIFIDMGYESHYWVMLVVFGGAFLLVTVLYFLLFWLPKYLDKGEEGKKGRKIIFFVLTPIVGFLTLVGMIGGPLIDDVECGGVAEADDGRRGIVVGRCRILEG